MATITERFGFTLPGGQDPASIIPLNLNTQNIELYLGMTQDMLAPLYDATEGTYEVDDIVTYDSVLYKCIEAVETPEDFDETKWVQTTAVSEGGGGAGAIEKTQSEYDALTPAQKENGAIYMVQSEGEETRTSLDMTNITTYQESSMSVSTSISETVISWNGGTTIGCTSFYTNPIDVTDIDYITYELETGSCYGNGSEAQQERWRFDVGYSSTAPSGMGNQELFDEYNEHKYSNTVYTDDECVLDVRNVTGNIYIIVNSHGWNATLSNIELVSVSSESVNKIYYMGTEYANTNGGSGGGGTFEGVEIYSESEYIVGKWIDGKKVYQKTINFGAMPAQGDSKSVAHNISNIDKIISWEAFGVNQSGQVMFVPNVSRGNVASQTSMSVNSTNVNIFNGSTSDLTDAYNGYVTIRYTKTVETPAPAWGGSVNNYYASFIDTDNIIDSGSYQGSFTYTATEDCFVNVAVVMSANNSATITIDGELVTSGWCASLNTINPTLPLKKGQTLVATSSTSNTSNYTVYGIDYGSGGSSSGSSGIDYSTDEQDTGIKWIDGSPIYQKTVVLTNLSLQEGSNNFALSSFNISNVQYVIEQPNGFLKVNASDIRTYPFGSAYSLKVYATPTNLVVERTGNNLSLAELTVTIKYTKAVS